MITQNSIINSVVLNDIFNNTCITKALDKELIKSDLKHVKRSKRKCLKAPLRHRLNEQMQYIAYFGDLAQRGVNKITYSISDNNIHMKADCGIYKSDIEIERIRACNHVYGTSISEFIQTKSKEAYIKLDFKDLFNGVILEVLGLDYISDIEGHLKNTRIATLNDGNILKDLGWSFDNLYKQAPGYACKSSEYVISSREGLDYFYERHSLEGSKFGDMITCTLKKLRLLILDELFKRCSEKFSVIEFGDTWMLIGINIDNNYDKLISELRKPLVARIFGRMFCFYPDMTVIERR